MHVRQTHQDDHQSDITQLLHHWHAGRKEALDDLFPLVYNELRHIAHWFLRHGQGRTLQPTGLVHEIYARLLGSPPALFESRSHFFNTARMIIRQILVQESRRRDSLKRGKDHQRQPLEEDVQADSGAPDPTLLISLNQCLEEFRRLDERKAVIIELRFFLGLNVDETAAVLALSERTVRREWNIAKMWLKRNLQQPA